MLDISSDILHIKRLFSKYQSVSQAVRSTFGMGQLLIHQSNKTRNLTRLSLEERRSKAHRADVAAYETLVSKMHERHGKEIEYLRQKVADDVYAKLKDNLLKDLEDRFLTRSDMPTLNEGLSQAVVDKLKEPIKNAIEDSSVNAYKAAMKQVTAYADAARKNEAAAEQNKQPFNTLVTCSTEYKKGEESSKKRDREDDDENAGDQSKRQRRDYRSIGRASCRERVYVLV